MDLWFNFIEEARIRKDLAVHMHKLSKYDSPILKLVHMNLVIFDINYVQENIWIYIKQTPIHNSDSQSWGNMDFWFLAFPSTPRMPDQNFDPPSRPLEKSTWNTNMSSGENKDFWYYLIEVALIW